MLAYAVQRVKVDSGVLSTIHTCPKSLTKPALLSYLTKLTTGCSLGDVATRTTFRVGFAVLLATMFLAFAPAQKGQAYTCTSKQCCCNGAKRLQFHDKQSMQRWCDVRVGQHPMHLLREGQGANPEVQVTVPQLSASHLRTCADCSVATTRCALIHRHLNGLSQPCVRRRV